VQFFISCSLPNYIFHLYFYVNITLQIHNLRILSPLLHDIYYQQYYEDLKRQCATVVLIGVVLILMLGYTFVFAGAEAAPQVGPDEVGIIVREILYIKTRVLLLLLLLLL